MDRKYSDPTIWDNSIDHDDEPDGSDGGYTKHGSFIVAPAMRELVRLRAENEALRDALISIEEYWNRDRNEKAMADACWHAVETAHAALAAKGDGE